MRPSTYSGATVQKLMLAQGIFLSLIYIGPQKQIRVKPLILLIFLKLHFI
jgi:hypothetical protein